MLRWVVDETVHRVAVRLDKDCWDEKADYLIERASKLLHLADQVQAWIDREALEDEEDEEAADAPPCGQKDRSSTCLLPTGHAGRHVNVTGSRTWEAEPTREEPDDQ